MTTENPKDPEGEGIPSSQRTQGQRVTQPGQQDQHNPEEDHPQGGPPGQTGEHPHGGPPGQTGEHPQGGPPGQQDEPEPNQDLPGPQPPDPEPEPQPEPKDQSAPDEGKEV